MLNGNSEGIQYLCNKLLNKKRISYILIVQNDHLKKEAGKMTYVSNKMVRGPQNPLDRMELNEK